MPFPAAVHALYSPAYLPWPRPGPRYASHLPTCLYPGADKRCKRKVAALQAGSITQGSLSRERERAQIIALTHEREERSLTPSRLLTREITREIAQQITRSLTPEITHSVDLALCRAAAALQLCLPACLSLSLALSLSLSVDLSRSLSRAGYKPALPLVVWRLPCPCCCCPIPAAAHLDTLP